MIVTDFLTPMNQSLNLINALSVVKCLRERKSRCRVFFLTLFFRLGTVHINITGWGLLSQFAGFQPFERSVLILLAGGGYPGLQDSNLRPR